MSKGSSPRPYSVSQVTFANNYDAIFGKKNVQVKVKEEIGGCGCGRSPTGQCVGWHGLTEQAFQQRLAEYQARSLEDNK
jgi:hypothetical protein